MKRFLLILLLAIGSQLTSPAQRINRTGYQIDKPGPTKEKQISVKPCPKFKGKSGILLKTGNADLYVPDSIMVFSNQDTTLELPEYSPDGKATILHIKIRAGNTWLPLYDYEFFYDDRGYPKDYILKEWKDNGWVNLYKDSETYDAQGHLLIYEDNEWLDNDWVNVGRYSYTYDNAWNQDSETGQVWTADSWHYTFKMEFTFDEQGNALTETRLLWLNDKWMNEERITRTFDSHNNNLDNIAEIWVANQWEKNGRWRYSYLYDPQGRVLSILSEHELELASWENGSRETLTYDSKGQITNWLQEDWIDETWQNKYYSTLFYDEPGNSILKEFFVWDAETGKWGHSETEPFTYLLNGVEQWTFFSGIKMTVHWVKVAVSSVQDYEQVKIGIAPNPVESILRITGDIEVLKTEVFTIDGTQLQINPKVYQNLLDVSCLPTGIYLIRVTTTEGTSIKKFLKD